MVDFLISYKNNTAKIGRVASVENSITTENNDKLLTEQNDFIIYGGQSSGSSFKIRSFDLPTALLTENNGFLATENGAFLIWDDTEEDSLVYRFLATDSLPSCEIDTDRIIYGD